MPATADDFFAIGPRIRALPIIHGSGDFAIRVREDLLTRSYDCLAIPLPPSFQEDVESAVQRLPIVSAVVQQDADGESDGCSYVPIDPCQGVIAAIRLALGERIPRAFIDRETPRFEAMGAVFPDPYALKTVKPESFAAAVLPSIPPPTSTAHQERIAWMAFQLRELETRYRSIAFVVSLLDWPWIRDAYMRKVDVDEPEAQYAPTETFNVDPRTLIFLLGELPFLTALYERGRSDLTPDDNLSVDGVKELVLEARDVLKAKAPHVSLRITPHLLSVLFRYVRNLSLMDRRLTPDLYTLVTAAKQTAGDDFALSIAETAREYPIRSSRPVGPLLRMSLDRAEIPGWGVRTMTTRLPGQTLSWRSLELRPRPPERDRQAWKQRWNPFGMCSWPAEDDRIESFQKHVRDQARATIGADLARSEKFSASVMDGIDLRETLRNWHTGDLYVKINPPDRGSIEAVVFLFETPADPRVYTHRATWYAEHADESTLAFFATDPMKELVGPGIAQARYGGALFLFPPRAVPDLWSDVRLDFATTLEERLIAGACLHTREKHVAIVSLRPPALSWRRAAKRFGKKLLPLPLKRFSSQLVERLRVFHVLNGKHVRSYAAEYIREM